MGGEEMDYRPVACAFHERLEFSVLRRLSLLLAYEDAGEVREERVMPLDVFTGGGAEWLTFRRHGGEVGKVRLDRIRTFSEVSS
jgi:Rho-binding antiterminator